MPTTSAERGLEWKHFVCGRHLDSVHVLRLLFTPEEGQTSSLALVNATVKRLLATVVMTTSKDKKKGNEFHVWRRLRSQTNPKRSK